MRRDRLESFIPARWAQFPVSPEQRLGDSLARIDERLKAPPLAKPTPIHRCVPVALQAQDIAPAGKDLDAASQAALAAGAFDVFRLFPPAHKSASFLEYRPGWAYLRASSARYTGRLAEGDIRIGIDHRVDAAFA
jgi:hypothetical protein